MSKRTSWMWVFQTIIAFSMAAFSMAAFSMTTVALADSSLKKSPQEKSGPEVAKMSLYTRPDGTNFYSISLTPKLDSSIRPAADVVVLLDTSASQLGEHRKRAFAGLTTLLSKLNQQDRIHLMAIDLTAVNMTENFTTINSKTLTKGLKKLNARAPLGSTDLSQGLSVAVKMFGKDKTRVRSIVYIGDGQSRAQLFDTDDFKQAVKMLVKNRISLTSYAIGPQKDISLLASLANLTGGMLAVDGTKYAPEKAGAFLAQSVHTVVAWPKSTKWPTSLESIYPSATPPLRTDRDMIVYGQGTIYKSSVISIQAEVAGKVISLSWKVNPTKASEDHTYLMTLTDTASKNGGLTVPTLGSAGLAETRRMLNREVENLARLGIAARQSGNVQGAATIEQALRLRDPRHTTLKAKRKKEAKKEAVKVNKKRIKARLISYQKPVVEEKADGNANAGDSVDKKTLEAFDAQKVVESEFVQKQVETELAHARSIMSSNPSGATDSLKLLLDTVVQSPVLNEETRAQLRDQILVAIRQAEKSLFESEERNARVQENIAVGKEKVRMLKKTFRKEEKLTQLMAQFRAMMEEGRYPDVQYDIAPEVQVLVPDSPLERLTSEGSSLTGNYRTATALRRIHNRGVVGQLNLIAKSAAPLPDDPPIVYPPAIDWQRMSKRRINRYSAVELKKKGPNEKKIFAELDKPTDLDMEGVPLLNLPEQIQQQHDIMVKIDKNAFTDASIDLEETEINEKLSGISLRSALKIILNEIGASFVVQNEVLLITTKEKINSDPSMRSTRVYPVADLVLPIPDTNFMGGFGNLGGFGDGGIGGGTGGDQGGFGGGGGVGGNFGGGGGQ